MNLTQQIDFDVECLTDYFQRLFVLAEETSKLHRPTPDPDLIRKQFVAELAKQFVPDNVSVFIRPDMAGNIYSFLDFRLGQLCELVQQKHNLALSYRDIKGNDGLDTYHKYLTRVGLLDLNSVQSSLSHLHRLRLVRNHLTHSGGHVSDQRRREIDKISGVAVAGSAIVISNEFIWDSLQHAQKYLHAVARQIKS
jgi:hypothetical protein